MKHGMSATLVPDHRPDAVGTAARQRGGLAGDAAARPAVSRTRRIRRTRTAPVVPTDCTVCLSAGSVRRGICDICGAVAVK